MSMTGFERDLGRLEAQVKTLTEDFAEMKQDIQDIKSVLQQAKGGTRLLLWSISISGLIASVVTYFWSIFSARIG